MISVVIPTLNAAGGLPATLACLWSANASGLIAEVVVSDGGSSDETLAVADAAGCAVVEGPPGRGAQLASGAAAARGDWLLFLHADTALEGWEEGAAAFLVRDEGAGVWPLAYAGGRRAALIAAGANLRTRFARLPYGDQGLLISRARYDRVGGHGDEPLFEDVSLVRRLVRGGGRGALRVLPGRAVTSPARYEASGYARRVLTNQRCLLAYARGVPPALIAARYR